MYYEVNPSETSKVLSQNIVYAMAGQPPAYPSAEFIVATTRWLNGDELCDMLGIPQANLKSKILVFAQCVFCCYIGYLSRVFPSFDERKIETSRKMLYGIIIGAKTGLGGETNFEFQYVPQLTTKTEGGKANMAETWMDLNSTAEKRSVKVLLICLVILGFMALVGMWLFGKLLELIGLYVFSPNSLTN